MALSFCICYLCISLFDLMENIVFTALSSAFLISVSIKYEIYYPVSNITAIIRLGLKKSCGSINLLNSGAIVADAEICHKR